MLVLVNGYSFTNIEIVNNSKYRIYVGADLSWAKVTFPGESRNVTTGSLDRDVYIYDESKKELAHIRDTGKEKWFDESFLAYQFVIKSGSYYKCMAVGMQKNWIWKGYSWKLEYKDHGKIDYVTYNNPNVTKEYPCW